jgi:hypothetical protein
VGKKNSVPFSGHNLLHHYDSRPQASCLPLLWSEVPSALHELAFRGEISRALADWALKRFDPPGTLGRT